MSRIIGGGMVLGLGGSSAVPLAAGVYTLSQSRLLPIPDPVEGVGWTLTTNLSDGSAGDTSSRVTGTGATLLVLHVLSSDEDWSSWELTAKYKGDITVDIYSYDGADWSSAIQQMFGTWTTHGSYSDESVTLGFDAVTAGAFVAMLTEDDTGSGNMSVSDSRGGTWISPNSLTYFLNDLTQYYTDTGATTPATTEGAVVAAWKNASAEKASQGTSAKRPTLNLSVAGLGNQPGLLFTDNQTTPTQSKYLDLGSILGTGLNANFYAFAQVARNAGLTRNGYVMSVVNATDAMRYREGNDQRSMITLNYGTITMKTRDDDNGIASLSWDGTYMVVGWNNKEQGRMQVNPATGPGFTSGDTLRIGNYSDAAGDDANWIGKLCRPTIGALTTAQRRTERNVLGNDSGLPNGGRGKIEFLVGSNSIGNGFGATAGWPALLQTALGTTAYDVFNNSTNSIVTKNLAQDCYGTLMPYGNWFTSILYKIDVGTDRENFDALTNAGSAPGWSTDQWAGWYVVFATGTNNKGYAAVVASNDANTLTLTSPGMPYTPTVGDTFYLFKPSEQGPTLFGVFHEMRNDLTSNGATEGPNSSGLSKTACLVYQRHVCACRALKAYGARLIGLTVLEDGSTAPYPAYADDLLTIQGWMEDDTEGLWDAWVGFNEIPEMTPFGTTYYQAGGPHPNDAGHAVLRAAIQAAMARLL